MRAGFKHGKWKEWYDTGMIKSIQHFTFGKEDGIQKEWYDNGKLMRESDMKGDTHIVTTKNSIQAADQITPDT